MDRVAALALLLALNAWVAWRYARLPIGPDEGIWMLTGWTGARYGVDYVDCKPPGIHLWMALLARITRRSVSGAKFLHHLAMGGFSLGAYLLTGSLGAGLLTTALLQSAWFYSYQSWMDAASAGFLLMAVLTPPPYMVLFLALAVLFNVKLAVPGAVWVLANPAMWLPTAISGGVLLLLVGAAALLWPDAARRVWFASVEVPRRMTAFRSEHATSVFRVWPHYLATSLLLAVAALVAGFSGGFDWRLALVVGSYVVLNSWGGVWRPNHFLPLVVVAAAAPTLPASLIVLLAEWVSLRGYTVNAWSVTYPEIAPLLEQARACGERLKGQDGELWVNSWNTQIYVYAQKPPRYGVQQLEIRDVTPERAEAAREKLRETAPEWIVLGPGATSGHPQNYRPVGKFGSFEVWA